MIAPRHHRLSETDCLTYGSNRSNPSEAARENRQDLSLSVSSSSRLCRSHLGQHICPTPACRRSQLHRRVPELFGRVPSRHLRPIRIAWTEPQRPQKKLIIQPPVLLTALRDSLVND